ncbi:MAG TPA: zf-HC2 domain-containing protein [Candidatus Angelobacter sp.]
MASFIKRGSINRPITTISRKKKMNTRIINHDEAVKDLMAERYLLGELNAAEREAYELHLFSCDACFEQVKVGTEFVTHLRHIGTEDPQAPLAPGFMGRLMTNARQPLPVTMFGLLLMVGGFAIHQSSEISYLKEPRAEVRSVLTGIAHGSSETNLIKVSKKSALSLNVEYTPKGEFISYRAQVLSSSGKALHTVALPETQVGTTASIALPADALRPGQYSIVVFGRRSDGTQEEVGRGVFELQFTDN